ncbi:UNVERIFIED_CONTAM: hypothetical protein FKN15_033873 [Acipenser sinensis]
MSYRPLESQQPGGGVGVLGPGQRLLLSWSLEKGSRPLPLQLSGEPGLDHTLLLLELGGKLNLGHWLPMELGGELQCWLTLDRSLEKGSRRLPLMPTGLHCGFAQLSW